jgi:chromosome segregation protein
MDKGAHFHKCDFQVHTPRDANWEGAGAVTDEERREYATELVSSCRSKALQAIAITDHHDVAFFRFIREAANCETDESGQPLAEGERLTVFPGIELTLGIPCQALLIFDADLPLEFLPLALTALGVTPAEASSPSIATVKKLDFMSFDELYKALDKQELLKDRYIVFPHFSDSGYKSLLRKDFEKHYVSMPCVGGYLDGDVPADENKSRGWRSITSGQDKNWGNKAIGIFQTSDSRRRDHAKLGAHVTWVKWTRPSAEALRQACLARHSRISHRQPHLPTIRITRLEVSNSKFLGPIALDFNPQYNALIGGRGTGKSTLLEYIRWALCDQPPADSPGDDVPDFQKRRRALIEGTLLPFGGVADVCFLLNEVEHVVRRKATGELTLKIGNAAFQSCTEENIRELLNVQAYSQKQLSAVGARLDELRRFVHTPIQGNLDVLEEEIGSVVGYLRAQFERVVRQRVLQRDIGAHDIELSSVKEQLVALRSSLKGLSEEDQKLIARQGHYELEQRFIQSLERDAAAALSTLRTAVEELNRVPTPVGSNSNQENLETLQRAHSALKQWSHEAQKAVSTLLDAFTEPFEGKPLAQYFESISAWKEKRATHRTEYEQAKQRAAAHEETLHQIHNLEERLAEINEAADRKKQSLSRLGDPVTEFSESRAHLRTLYRRRAGLLETQCKALTGRPQSRLKATVLRAADIEPLAANMRELLKGTRTRGERVDALMQQITIAADPLIGGDPADLWHTILDELYEFAWTKVEDEALTQLPPSPNLDAAEFSRRDKLALARQLEPAAWLELMLFDLKDLPVFEYEVRENDFIPFENASPGQQATALLSILLLQDGPPLLIDQPEDDLNMKIINEIVETLWQAKTHRQVIFVSHNANLVVNGDAELVVCCDYRTTATESGGQIKLAGAIDVPEINSEIAEVMEGGIEAFKLRYEKYGF